MKYFIERDWLYNQYVNKERSIRDIAGELGMMHSALRYRMKKLGIPRRTSKEGNVILHRNNTYWDKDWLYNQYIVERKSASEIGKICNADSSIIKRWLKKHNILVRSSLEGLCLFQLKKEKKKYMDREWLYHQYIELQKNGTEVAKICGCGRTTIYTWLDRLKIPRRYIAETLKKWYEDNKISDEVLKKMSDAHIGKYTGSSHWNWQDGKSFEPYCSKFNFRKKEEIRNKYNRVCIVSGISALQNGCRLSVDHVDENKMQGCKSEKWSLVPLASRIHGKMNKKENHLLLELLLINNKKAQINYEGII